ncbi:hypothetical protein ZWY2020_040535 [Hordeum vulgare]|nr:hypothetical protein ZWY2020_040535 [Hordeum vulgare]
MAGDDRLSALPDQLLRRVLHFAPAKEAASTSALRRWRSPLLRSSGGAVNLETRLERVLARTWGEQRKSLEGSFLSRRNAFVSAAQAALAADGQVTRLTLRVEFEFDVSRWLLHPDDHKRDGSPSQDQDVIATLLSDPAARRVEYLRLAFEGRALRSYELFNDAEREIARKEVGEYTLSLGSLPWETLRVLDLTSCRDILPPAAAVVFTQLSSTRLRHCTVRLGALRASSTPRRPRYRPPWSVVIIIIIAPTDDVSQSSHHASRGTSPPTPPTEVVLRCPAATVLVLDKCSWRGNNQEEAAAVVAVEIHAPKLRYFLYRGLLRRFAMSPRPPELARADLHFPAMRQEWKQISTRTQGHQSDKPNELDPHRNLVMLWQFLQDLSSAKELKLR